MYSFFFHNDVGRHTTITSPPFPDAPTDVAPAPAMTIDSDSYHYSGEGLCIYNGDH